MLFKDIASLIWTESSSNAMGDTVEVEKTRVVFVNKESVRQSEFYQAATTGLRPELMLEVMTVDYQDERRIEFDGAKYNIIRTYEKKNERTELVCQGITAQNTRGKSAPVLADPEE